MLQFSLKKLPFLNYFLLALILITSLFTARSLISFFAYKGGYILSGLSENTPVKAVVKRNDINHYASIVNKNPFGSPMNFHVITSAGSPESETVINEVPLTDLTLIGTVVGPKNLSYAIFEGNSRSPGNRQEIFAHGETVYDYGTLTEILTGSVKMKKNGKTYMLEIIESGKNIKKSRTGKKNGSKAPFVKKVGRGKYQLNRKQVRNSIENPERILTDARLLPNFTNGKQEGYIISEVKPGGLYEDLGLKNGDILLRVNNLEISNPEVAIQAMSTIKGTNNVNLDIIRNNRKMTLNYQMR